MVYSNLNSIIEYDEKKEIDSGDKEHETIPYEMEIHGKDVIIVFGKPNYTKINKGVVFCPIYMVVNNKISSKIGILEFPKDKALAMFKQDKEIDINEVDDPLLFSFVSERFIDRSGSNISMFTEKEKAYPLSKDLEELNNKEKPEEVELVLDDQDEVMKVKIDPYKKQPSLEEIERVIQNGIFEINSSIKPPKSLVEESLDEANTIKSQYKNYGRGNWIEKFMKNNNYQIHDVENNGDCFFAVIRDAFRQIGYKTSVKKLRSIVAREATHNIFEEQRQLFLDLDSTKREYEKEKEEIKRNMETLKERAKRLSKKDKDELSSILEQVNNLKERHGELTQLIDEQQQLISENVSDFSFITTLEEFRNYILSPNFWADSWAISVIERHLQIKMIILSERAYIDGDLDGILLCGEASDAIQTLKVFQPKHYIITTFSGDHFRLVSYKNKRILDFHEIPYHIKSLILNKCMESSHGIYSLIPQFQELQDRMGIVPKTKTDEEELEDENNSSFNNSVVLVFHEKSAKTPKPGKGVHEKMDKTQVSKYDKLAQIKDWRKKLDDSWDKDIITVDGEDYASVEHYYQGSKFANQNKEFQKLFTIHSGSPFAKDVDLAICAGSKSGKLSKKCKKKAKEDVLLRPANITIDTDFYGKRSQEERLKGLKSKFSDKNKSNLNTLVLATKDAKLQQFDRGSEPQTDHLLMAVRDYLKK